MALKQECPFCKERTVAKRLLGFYVGSTEQLKLWECRSCNGIWSKKTVGGQQPLGTFFWFFKSHHKLIDLNEHHIPIVVKVTSTGTWTEEEPSLTVQVKVYIAELGGSLALAGILPVT